MRIRSTLFILPLALLVLACQPAPPAAPAGLSDEDRATIAAVSSAFVEAANAANWAALGALYTQDASVLPPNAPAVQGREAIQALFASFPPISGMELTSVEVDGAGDIAYVRGTYRLTMTPPGAAAIQDSGKFIEIRKRGADNSWLLYLDIYNSDVPLPQ